MYAISSSKQDLISITTSQPLSRKYRICFRATTESTISRTIILRDNQETSTHYHIIAENIANRIMPIIKLRTSGKSFQAIK
jgi:hypothetical protein